jgi:hypothetical protein
MQTKALIILLLGLLTNIQSVIGQTNPSNLIRIKYDFANTGPVKMSEVFSEINYLPLETNPNCLIGYMNIPDFGKDILIRSYSGAVNGSQGIYRFSDKGKYLNKIGNIGRGPGEYQDNTDVVLVQDTVFVVSSFSNDILCYSLTGTFLKKYHLNLKARPKSIVQLPDKSFMISLFNPSEFGILLKTDRNFNIKTGFIKNQLLDNNPLAYGFPKSGKKIYYYYTYFDTIFEISKGYPVPSIIIDYGKYKKSKEKLSIYEKNNAILIKPNISDFSVSDDYLILCIYYPYNGDRYTALYRAKDGKQVAWTDLINDIDNGTLDRWSGFLLNNNLIFSLMPSTILERFGKMTNSEKLDPKNSRFVEMASKITPESNPVLMFCKLK